MIPKLSAIKILVVDDDPQIRRALRTVLAIQRWTVIEARDGQEAIEEIEFDCPNVVLLDINLPGVNGLETCRRIRNLSDVQIIVLTVRETEQDKVAALGAGADDYIAKPFGIQELLMRIRVAIRRISEGKTQPFDSAELNIDFERRKIQANGKPVHLTPIEFNLLKQLVANQGRPVAYRNLFQPAWGSSDHSREHLRVFIRQLRKKIEPDPEQPRYIHRERYVGYRFDPSCRALSKIT